MIETQRLVLEPIRKEHAKIMFDGLNDDRLYTFVPEEAPASLRGLEDRYQRLEDAISPDGKEVWLNWIVFLRDDHIAIGYLQATVRQKDASEIAYALFQKYWCNGFASEAAKAVISHVFDSYATPAVAALIDTRNDSSNEMVSKLGFHLVEIINDADYFKGATSHENRYEVTRQEWLLAISLDE